MNGERHVMISGGSRGLGEGLVLGLLDAGYRVSTFSRKVTPFIEQLRSGRFASRVRFQEADMGDDASLRRFVEDSVAQFGVPWALVNNAGLARDALHVLMAESAVSEVIRVNLTGTLSLTKYCARHMLVARAGRILTITSIVGLRGYRGLVTYGATKAALEGMTRALARELGEAGITVNSLAPGYLETEMSATLADTQRRQITGRTPLGRLGLPADCVPAMLFLLSDGASFITGHTLVVDGGITC